MTETGTTCGEWIAAAAAVAAAVAAAAVAAAVAAAAGAIPAHVHKPIRTLN